MSQTHAMASQAAQGMDADLKPLLDGLAASLKAAQPIETPYRHWLPRNLLPDVHGPPNSPPLPFEAPDLHGVSGKRELHNDTRQYFDAANNARFPVCDRLARLLQAPQTVRLLQDANRRRPVGHQPPDRIRGRQRLLLAAAPHRPRRQAHHHPLLPARRPRSGRPRHRHLCR
ncbi:MAG: hypothetical protein WDN45_10580 [Caulobacteraceae bacterium]